MFSKNELLLFSFIQKSDLICELEFKQEKNVNHLVFYLNKKLILLVTIFI